MERIKEFFGKVKMFLKEDIGCLLLLTAVVIVFVMIFHLVSSFDIHEWLEKPISWVNIKDILIITFIHAWFSRSKCECKNKKYE